MNRNIKEKNIFEKLDIPRPGLKLLVDPSQNYGLGANERLGPNLVKNSDFRDFTMDDMGTPIGRWVFNDQYAKEKSNAVGDRYAAHFDGVDDYYYLAGGATSADLLPGTGDASISYWFVKNKDDSNGVLIHKGSWAAGYWATGRLNSSTQLSFRFYDGGVHDIVAATWSTLSVGWHNVTFVIDRSLTTNGAVLAYLDGNFVTATTFSTAANLNNDGSFVIGGADQGVAVVQCDIGAFGYWDRVLHPSEIRKYAKSQIVPSGAVAYYDFNSVSSGHIVDQSGNAHTLSVAGAPVAVNGLTKSVSQDWAIGGALESQELATNGTFDSDLSGWGIVSNDSNNTVTYESGACRFISDGSQALQMNQDMGLVAGALYKLSLDIVEISGAGGIKLQTLTDGDINYFYTIGYKEVYFYAASSSLRIFRGASAQVTNALLDNISVKRVLTTGNHLVPQRSFNTPDRFVLDAPNYKNGKALQFNGTSDYLYIPAADAGDFNPGPTSFSISCWIYANAINAGQIVYKRTGATGWSLGYTTNPYNKLVYYIGDGVNQVFGDLTSVDINPGSWYHVVLVFDRSGNTLKYYVNGTLAQTVDISALTGSVAPNTDLRVGSTGSSAYWNGSIAEVSYWNSVLSDASIRKLAGGSPYWEIRVNDGNIKSSNDGFNYRMQSLVSNGTSDEGIRQNLASVLETGKLYKAIVRVGSIDTNDRVDFRLDQSNGSYSLVKQLYTIDSNKEHSFYIRYTSPYSYIACYISNVNSTDRHLVVESIAVHEVIQDERSNLVANLANSNAVELGPEEILEPRFLNGGADWALPGDAEVSNGYLKVGPAVGGTSTHNIYGMTWEPGALYRFEVNCVYNTLDVGMTGYALRPFISWTVLYSAGQTGRKLFYARAADVPDSPNRFTFYTQLGSTGFALIDLISVRKVRNAGSSITINNLETTAQLAHPYAYSFDKVNDRIEFSPTYTEINVDVNDFMWWGWGYYTGDKTGFAMMKLYAFGGGRWGCYMRNDGTLANGLFVYLGDSLGNFYYPTSGPNVFVANNWYFCTVVVKRSTNKAFIYINGELVATSDISTLTNSLNTVGTSSYTLSVGAYNNSSFVYSGGLIGICGLHIYNGLNGAPSTMPENYVDLIRRMYNSTKDLYDKSLPAVSLSKPPALNTWSPERHSNALRLLVDPYRQQQAGYNNTNTKNWLYNYAEGGRAALESCGISSFINSGTYPFDTFTSSGMSITSAIITSGAGAYRIVAEQGSSIAFNVGDIVRISGNFKLNSGLGPLGRFQTLTVGGGSTRSTDANFNTSGYVEKIIQITMAGNWLFEFTGGNDGNWAFENIKIERVVNNAQGLIESSLAATAWENHEAGILFDGVNDYVDYNNILNPRKSSFILFAWTKHNQSSAAGRIWSKQLGSPLTAFYLRSETLGRFRVGFLGNSLAPNFYTEIYTINKWKLVAAVFDRNSDLTAYIDAVADPNSSDISGLADYDFNPAERLQFGGWTSELVSSPLGISGIYMFDGRNGAAPLLPFDYKNIIEEIYNNTKHLYDTTYTDVPYTEITTPEPWTPILHTSALKLLVDPYREHLAGRNNTTPKTKLINDYSSNGITYGAELLAGGMQNGSTYAYEYLFTNGNNILYANNSSAFGGAASVNAIALVAGHYYEVSLDLVVNAGAGPDVRIVGGQDGRSSITTDLGAGLTTGTHKFVFKSTVTGNRYLELSVGSGVATTFSVENISVKELTSYGKIGLTSGGLESTGWQKEWGAIKFDGTDDYVNFGDVALLGTHDFIISMWIKPDIPGNGYKTMLSNWVSSSNSFQFRVQSTDLYWWHEYQDTIVTMFTTHNPLPNQQWSLVSVVVSRDNPGKLYVNTSEVSAYGVQPVIPSTHNFDFTGGQGLNLGRGYGAAEYYKDFIGVSTVYVFNGQNGAASALPADYEDIIDEIYENTRDIYGV